MKVVHIFETRDMSTTFCYISRPTKGARRLEYKTRIQNIRTESGASYGRLSTYLVQIMRPLPLAALNLTHTLTFREKH